MLPALVILLGCLTVAHSRLGAFLVDGRGHTLYLFTADSGGSISCVTGYSNCPASWPPLLTGGKPLAGPGVDTGLLGTVHRTSPAGLQVTYGGHPLYLYVDDKRPGDVKGQGVIAMWYVVSPKGTAIKKK